MELPEAKKVKPMVEQLFEERILSPELSDLDWVLMNLASIQVVLADVQERLAKLED